MNPQPQCTVIGDDLTGAADSAACFSRKGLVTLLHLDGVIPPADVLAFSTDSRELVPEDAVKRVRLAARKFECHNPGVVIYKKIDSTLRGHPAAELAALMTETGRFQALIAPAFPAQGRTTAAGHQLLHGVPIEATHFGTEVRNSHLPSLFGVPGMPIKQLSLQTLRQDPSSARRLLERTDQRLVVADAETDRDLDLLAGSALAAGVGILCGSAGLAGALCRVAQWKAQVSEPILPLPRRGPTLAVAGSRHPSTLEQVRKAESAGVVVLQVPVSVETGDFPPREALRHACTVLGQGRDVILTPSPAGRESLPPARVADTLALVARGAVETCTVGALVLTGGDIARAVLTSLGASAVWLKGEVQPGIPHGRLIGGTAGGMRVVTKAGGFGQEGTLLDILEWSGRCLSPDS